MRFLMLLMLCLPVWAQDEDVIVIQDDSQVEGVGELSEKLDAQVELPGALKEAQAQVKLDPNITKAVREHYVDATIAEQLMHTPDKLISKSVPVVNGPGQDAEVIEVAVWYGVTITFKDANGESLFVNRYKLGSDRIVNIDDGRPLAEGETEGEALATPYLTLTHKHTVGATNLHVWLEGANQSLSFYIKIVEKPKIYADRINYIVVKPNGAGTERKLVLDEYDALTMVMNNRKPDANAQKIDFSDPSVVGWALGDMMWVRTTKRLVFPTFSPQHALSSDSQDGVRVYYVSKHPIIHVVDDSGQFQQLLVESQL